MRTEVNIIAPICSKCREECEIFIARYDGTEEYIVVSKCCFSEVLEFEYDYRRLDS